MVRSSYESTEEEGNSLLPVSGKRKVEMCVHIFMGGMKEAAKVHLSCGLALLEELLIAALPTFPWRSARDSRLFST